MKLTDKQKERIEAGHAMVYVGEHGVERYLQEVYDRMGRPITTLPEYAGKVYVYTAPGEIDHAAHPLDESCDYHPITIDEAKEYVDGIKPVKLHYDLEDLEDPRVYITVRAYDDDGRSVSVTTNRDGEGKWDVYDTPCGPEYKQILGTLQYRLPSTKAGIKRMLKKRFAERYGVTDFAK